jgi:hypothetical protein
VYLYDAAKKAKLDKCEVWRFQTYWLRNKEPQWYVVVRDKTREKPFEVKDLPIKLDFSLPEEDPRLTIKDFAMKD